MYRLTLLLVFFAVNAHLASACGGAFQRKLFPVGVKDDTLLFREISITRLPKGDSFGIHTRLLYFNYDLCLLRSLDTDSAGYHSDDFYKNESDYIHKLVFQGLKPEKMLKADKYAYGDYLDSTSFAEVNWELDSLVNRVVFRFSDKEWNEVRFYPLDEMPMFEDYPTPEYCPQNLLTRGPHIGSIRILKSGSRKLMIVHLCNSDALGDSEMDWKHQEIPFQNLNKEKEFKTDPMASHSYGTDVLMWVE